MDHQVNEDDCIPIARYFTLLFSSLLGICLVIISKLPPLCHRLLNNVIGVSLNSSDSVKLIEFT